MSYVTRLIKTNDDVDETILNECFNNSLFLFDDTFQDYKFWYNRAVNYQVAEEDRIAYLADDTNRVNFLRCNYVDRIINSTQYITAVGFDANDQIRYPFVIEDTNNSNSPVGYGFCGRFVSDTAWSSAPPGRCLKIIFEIMKGSTNQEVIDNYYQYWGDMAADPSTSPASLLGLDCQILPLGCQSHYDFCINSNTGFIQHGEGTLPADGYVDPYSYLILKYGH